MSTLAPAVATAPAATIRDYLADSDGPVEVPFHNLLTTFEFDDPGPLERQQIVAELAHAGVYVNRSLADLRPDDSVRLRLMAPGPGPSLAPWDHEAPTIPPTNASPAPTVKRRWPARVGAGALVLAFAAGAGAGAFLYGRDTRLSDGEVEAKLTKQASHDKGVYTKQAQVSLAKQKDRLTKKFETNKQTAVNQAAAAGEQRGQSAGYSAGQEQGFESGKTKGYQDGHLDGEIKGYGDGVQDTEELAECYDPEDFEYVC